MSQFPSPDQPTSQHGAAPPGWYPSAEGQRYWDGTQWTSHVAPGAGVAPVAPTAMTPFGTPVNTWAMISHIPIGGFVLPLIGLLVEGPKDPFVKIHATEALNFHIAVTIVSLASFIFALITLGFGLIIAVPLVLVLSVLALVWGIQGAIAANKGEFFKYPINIRMIKDGVPH